KSHVEKVRKERKAIGVTEIPYQVNKAKLIERIAETVREKMIEGISELRDESDREGLRIVIEIKRDAEPDIVLNQLYRHTALQTSFGVNMLALNGGRPELLTLRDIIAAFVAFREVVITRRTSHSPFALSARDRDRARQDCRRAARSDHRDRRLSRNPALARASDRGAPQRALGDQGAVCDTAAHGNRGCRVRSRYRGADPARA